MPRQASPHVVFELQVPIAAWIPKEHVIDGMHRFHAVREAGQQTGIFGLRISDNSTYHIWLFAQRVSHESAVNGLSPIALVILTFGMCLRFCADGFDLLQEGFIAVVCFLIDYESVCMYLFSELVLEHLGHSVDAFADLTHVFVQRSDMTGGAAW